MKYVWNSSEWAARNRSFIRRLLITLALSIGLSATVARAQRLMDSTAPDVPPSQPDQPTTRPDSANASSASENAPQYNGAPKTGQFQITFTERSPLSVPDVIARRYGKAPADLNTDYDLANQPFLIAVPPDYDSSVACGILVYLGDGPVDKVPQAFIPLLASDHLIFVAPMKGGESPLHKAGLAFDAIYNLNSQYSIDSKRIFLMTAADCSQIALSTSDVFTGQIMVSKFDYFHTILMKAPDGHTIFQPMSDPQPPRALLPLDKERPYAMVLESGLDPKDPRAFLVAEMKRDGFKRIVQIDVTPDDIKYPNYNLKWFERAIGILDRAQAYQTPSTQSTELPTTMESKDASPVASAGKKGKPTKPTKPEPPLEVPDEVSQADRLLSLAKAFISSGHPELARTKLYELIKEYPDDPDAAKAKELLQQIHAD